MICLGETTRVETTDTKFAVSRNGWKVYLFAQTRPHGACIQAEMEEWEAYELAKALLSAAKIS